LDPPLDPVEDDPREPDGDDRAEDDEDESQPVVAGEAAQGVTDALHPRTLGGREQRGTAQQRVHSSQGYERCEAGWLMVPRWRNTGAVIELEPAERRRPPEMAVAPAGARSIAVVMGVLLAAVLAGGAVAGHSGPPPPRQQLTFDEPTPAASPPSDTAGAGESAAAVGGALPT